MGEAKRIVVPLIKSNNAVMTLKDIEVPDKYYHRVRTGVDTLDKIFGGEELPGLVVGTTILFTGAPGAGKSTASLQIAEMLQKNAGRNLLYNMGEENPCVVKMRSTRLGLDGNFSVSTFTDVDELCDFCEATGVEVLIQDSIQTLIDGELRSQELLKTVTKKLHVMAHENDIIVFLIGHITKGGTFAGPMTVKHDVDVHAHMDLNKKTMARELVLEKNRNGPSGIPYECSITARGLDFANATVVEDDEGQKPASAAENRRESVLKLIKERLIDGEALSGYCFTRLKDPIRGTVGLDCSGGFWRGLLERAVHELRAEGNTVTEERVDGRMHYKLEV